MRATAAAGVATTPLSLLVLLLLSTAAVYADNAPLTTNNAVSACVQYGGCTTEKGATLTISQKTPVTPPPSMTIPVPTASDQMPAFEASLASAGALSAFQSRMSGGMNSNTNAGATSMPTGSVIPQAPSSAAGAQISQSRGKNAAASVSAPAWRMWALSPAVAVVAAAAGAAFII